MGRNLDNTIIKSAFLWPKYLERYLNVIIWKSSNFFQVQLNFELSLVAFRFIEKYLFFVIK